MHVTRKLRKICLVFFKTETQTETPVQARLSPSAWQWPRAAVALGGWAESQSHMCYWPTGRHRKCPNAHACSKRSVHLITDTSANRAGT